MNCARQLCFSVAPAVRFHDVAHPVSAGHKCSGKAVSTMRVSLCASPLSSPHPGRMLRRECLHLPPFFALPFALFPPCFVVSVQVSGDVLSSVQERCPKLFTPESSNKICARTCAQRQLLQ